MANTNRKRKPKAIIIGAGVSGLQMADLLQTSGFEVTILEAKDRIGGRIKEDRTLADFPIELGGEEVHGEHSFHYKMAFEAGAEFIDESKLTYYVEYADHLYRADKLIEKEPLFQRVLDMNWGEVYSYSNNIKKISMSQYIQENKFPAELLDTIEGIFANEWSTDLDKLSVGGLMRYNQNWDFGHQNFLIKNISNYQIITKKFSNVLDKVILNAPVTNITYGPDKEVVVTDKTGRIYVGDIVVVSIPVSQLKKETIKFEPELPTKKKEAIQKLTMEPAMKVFLKFKEKFWNDDLGVLLTKGVIKHSWVSSTCGKSEKCHILTCLITGQIASRLSKLEDIEIVQMILDDLTRLYGSGPEEAFEDFIVQNWGKEEYIEGGYTSPGLNEDEDTRKILAEPIGNKIYFVGEAICNRFAVISGAIQSSFDAFEEICKNFPKKELSVDESLKSSMEALELSTSISDA